ncbi:hypothetical protein CC78DRAFT_573578 [Lojkania enalia]|uniref:Uncharacterized protein n=1 Tax=Lojkania enalia TaxID=147567 RepID=A0A9P4NDG9_9PLEO|nr:hypothetical protein CC78DRAFT_573578 [Didymosphaeria enalia]
MLRVEWKDVFASCVIAKPQSRVRSIASISRWGCQDVSGNMQGQLQAAEWAPRPLIPWFQEQLQGRELGGGGLRATLTALLQDTPWAGAAPETITGPPCGRRGPAVSCAVWDLGHRLPFDGAKQPEFPACYELLVVIFLCVGALPRAVKGPLKNQRPLGDAPVYIFGLKGPSTDTSAVLAVKVPETMPACFDEMRMSDRG